MAWDGMLSFILSVSRSTCGTMLAVDRVLNEGYFKTRPDGCRIWYLFFHPSPDRERVLSRFQNTMDYAQKNVSTARTDRGTHTDRIEATRRLRNPSRCVVESNRTGRISPAVHFYPQAAGLSDSLSFKDIVVKIETGARRSFDADSAAFSLRTKFHENCRSLPRDPLKDEQNNYDDRLIIGGLPFSSR